ncbi:MAG: FAD-dependent oxidoreductase [Solobacterium sp.]|nr:FAD-dependent oxidoreductase [Solobacterium sp.]
MKKTLKLVSAVLLSASMAACSQQSSAPAQEEAGKYTAGTYSATAEGFGGPVTVTITTDKDAVTDVKIEGEKETPTVGGAALEELTKQVLETGSGEIDGVSGATLTSNAVKEAAASALAQAEGKTEETSAEIKAGTYTGTGEGYNGPVEVSATIDENGKLTALEVTSSGETDHVGTVAYDIMIPAMLEAGGSGVDNVSGATFSSRALKEAVNAAAAEAGVNASEFSKAVEAPAAGEPVEGTWDVVVVGAGGAGIAAAAQAAQNGETVLVIEQNAEVGGNTLVSGGQYQSVMPYLVWDPADPDATTGTGFDGKTYNKVKSVNGCINELKTILNWNEAEFDEAYYVDNEYVIGDIGELSKHGVHADYLPILKELKQEITAYLAWAQPKLDAGTPESELTLFSTLNLHKFQTYYGGLRQSADKSQWIYGDVDLVSQFIDDGQDLKPWLESMGSTFIEDTQPTLIGALWYRENEFIGAEVDTDGDGKTESYGGRWGTYFVAPMTAFLNANEENKLMKRTTATDLIVEDGKVTGVKAEMFDGTPVTAHANKGVILATGGYAANIQLVLDENIYWSSEYLTNNTQTTNRSSLVGSGIEMAEKAGAAVTGMGFTQLMPISWVDNGDLAFGGGNYAAWINPFTGKRFVDEGSERDVLSLAEFRNGMEVNGTKGVFIEIYNAEQKMPAPKQLDDGDFEGRYYRVHANAEELGALLKKLGAECDAETVIDTLTKYDMAVMGQGEFEDAPKAIASRTVGNVEKNEDGTYKVDSYDLANTLVTVRLMAPSTHHTMGGIVVDTERHVLDGDGNIIEGLYAAGEVTGGIHGGNRLGGNAIVEIFVSGRTAANAVTADNQ